MNSGTNSTSIIAANVSLDEYIIASIFLSLHVILLLLTILLFFSRHAYTSLLCCTVKSSKRKSYRGKQLLHLLLLFNVLFMFFQTTSAVLWMAYLALKGTQAGAWLYDLEFFFAIVGYLPLALLFSLMIKMWANVLFSWQFSGDAKKRAVASWVLNIALVVINVLILLDVIALVVFLALSRTYPEVSRIYIILVSPGIFAVVQGLLVLVAAILGVMVIRTLMLSPSSSKQLVLQKIGIAVVGFLLSTLIRVAGATLIALVTKPEWPVLVLLRQLPDVLIMSVILVVFFPFNLACKCCNAQISRLMQPIMNDEDSDSNVTPRKSRVMSSRPAVSIPEVAAASPSPSTPVASPMMESNPII